MRPAQAIYETRADYKENTTLFQHRFTGNREVAHEAAKVVKTIRARRGNYRRGLSGISRVNKRRGGWVTTTWPFSPSLTPARE